MTPPPVSWRPLFAAMLQLLLEEWGPIHMRDVPEAQDEYDGYALQICGMLRRHATKHDLAAHLLAFETDRMGLANTEAARLHAEQIAERLFGLASTDEGR